MDVKTAIDGRKNAFFSAYEIKDQGLIDEIDQLFVKIEEFGNTCSDYSDFEAKFQTSELNQEYINLFTKVATSCESKLTPPKDDVNAKSDAEFLAEEVADDIRGAVKSAASPFRHAAYEARKEALRSTEAGSVIFNAVNQFENLRHIGKVIKDKNKKEEEED